MPVPTINTATCKSALVRTRIPGYNFCLNPYVGCAHRCRYCYADTTLRFANIEGKWGEFVTAKVNFPQVLKKELVRRRSPLGRVLLGTVTDAYQPAEVEYRLTRSSLQAFVDEYPAAEIDILTKSDLVTRDADLLKKLRGCSVGFSINNTDDKLAVHFEPGASTPSARLQAAGLLVGAGIHVWVFIAPVLPGVTDAPGRLESLFTALQKAGIKDVYIDPLNPYSASVERLRQTYRQAVPHALKALDYYLANRRSYLKKLSTQVQILSGKYGFQLSL